jgi:fumarate hydratase class II
LGRRYKGSLENFEIGTEKIPVEVIRAFGILKLASRSDF